MPPRTDDELLAAIAHGDRAALVTLYDRHAAVVFAVARHVVGDRQRAEDLLHDVFLELARRAPRRDAVRWLVRRVLERGRVTAGT